MMEYFSEENTYLTAGSSASVFTIKDSLSTSPVPLIFIPIFLDLEFTIESSGRISRLLLLSLFLLLRLYESDLIVN